MTRVGVRGLKDHLSEYLRRAGDGERIVVTDRGAPVAVLTPIEESDEVRRGWDLVREGVASWSGGKPRGSARAAVLKGKKTTAGMVLEDRR
ncbi:MAG: type II toxin-antitoxin system prevent-host-death family antitoxin [Thermoanaerobaculia bacterium]|nr:type II toxin-antitoxin system prevent-host-death family antitoxin [Thermoanaerobaculia bacterium]